MDKVIVRLPDGMRDMLKSEAKGRQRTMNAEIVARLEQTFKESRPAGLTYEDALEIIGVLDRTLAALGRLASNKAVAKEMNDAKVFGQAYELGAFRRSLLQVKWSMDYERDQDLQAAFASSEAYIAKKFAEMDLALGEHGMSAGREG